MNAVTNIYQFEFLKVHICYILVVDRNELQLSISRQLIIMSYNNA